MAELRRYWVAAGELGDTEPQGHDGSFTQVVLAEDVETRLAAVEEALRRIQEICGPRPGVVRVLFQIDADEVARAALPIERKPRSRFLTGVF